MKNDKKIIRRTIAFAAALSFTYFSYSAELSTMVSYADPDTPEGTTTTSSSAAVTTPQSAVSEAPVTSTEPKTSDSENDSSVTTTVTTETTTVTTTTEPKIDTTFSVSINGYLDKDIQTADNYAREAIRKLFNLADDDNIDYDNGNYKVTVTSDSEEKTDDIIVKSENILPYYKDYYIAVGRGSNNNDHLLRIEKKDDNNIILNLCYLVTQLNVNNFRYNDETKVIENNTFILEGIISHKNKNGTEYFYADRNNNVTVTGKDAWYPMVSGQPDQDSNTVEIPITDYKNENVYIPVIINSEDQPAPSKTIIFQKNDNQHDKIGEIKFKEAEVKVTINDESGNNLHLYIDDQKIDKLKWGDINNKTFKLNNDNNTIINDFELDIKFKHSKINNGKGSDYLKDYKGSTFSIDSSKINEYINHNNTTIEINIRPDKLERKINLDGATSYNNNFDIIASKIHIPQIQIYNNKVYYLSTVEFSEGTPKNIAFKDNSLSHQTSDYYYTEIDYETAKTITAVNYVPFGNDSSANELTISGIFRNDKIKSIEKSNNSYCIINIENNNQSTEKTENSETESSVPEPNYYVLYKTSLEKDKLHFESFKESFLINKKAEESETIEIISVYKNLSAPEIVSSKNLIEIDIAESDKLFYIDRENPQITSDHITIKQYSDDTHSNLEKSNEKDRKKWFNKNVTLEFSANDTDDKIDDPDHKDDINTHSIDCKEIKSVTIGSSNSEVSYTFTRNNSKDNINPKNSSFTNWKLSSKGGETLPYIPIDLIATRTENGFNFEINIKVLKSYINENVCIYVTDIAGNTSKVQEVKLKVDTEAPTVSKLDITDLNSIVEGKKAYNSANSKSPKTLTAAINANDLYSPDTTSTESATKLTGSGIKDAIVEYLYDTKPITKLPYSETFKLDKIPNGTDAVKGTLNINDDMENTSGIIRLTVTDNADNQTICYYKNENTFVKEEKNASEIILDFKKPVCELKADDKNAFNKKADNEVQKWFRKYPEGITIGAYDEEVYKFSVSGLKSFDLKINGKNISVNVKDNNIDTDALKNNNYSLKFEDIDSDTFSVSLVNNTNASEKPITLFESISKPSDGKYEIELSAADYADNTVHNKKTYRFYIDDSKPSSDGTFSIEYTSGEGDPGVTDFGTFANKPVRIKIHAEDDKNSVPSSGLNRAVLIYTDENNKETKFDNIPVISDKKLEFTFEDIPKDKLDGFSSGAFSIVLYDNVENSAVISKLNNKKTGSTIVFDNKAPDIDITLPEEDTVILGDKMWSNHDVDVKFDISDKESGIASIDYEMNHNKDNTNTQITVGNPAYSEFKETESITLSTKNDKNKDGKFVFTIKSTDNAGNEAEEKTVEIFKDTTPPEIVNFDFSGAGSGEDHEDKSKYGPDIPYYHFSNSDDTKIVRVHAIDKNASSEINKIEIKLISSNGKEYDEEKFYLGKPDKAANDSYYNIEYDQYFLIPNDFKGIIAAKATDNVGNELEEWKVSYGYIDEIPDTHYNETDPYEIILPETEYHDANGNRLYNHDIDAVIKVKDTISGIRNIIVNYPDYSRNLETDLKNNNISDEWSLEQSDINLTTKVSTVINQTSNKNGNEITLTAFDNTGNEIRTSEPVVFSIDKTKPQIELSFDNNDADGKYSNYFKAGRTATIKIKERNFTPDNVSTSYPVSGTWTLISGPGTEGTDEAVYQNTVSFEKDGNYRLTVNCSDICGNEAENPRDSGEFTIDLTAPVINVSFDNNESQNTNYFNQKRTATIDIEELNFDPARVEITGTRNGSSENFPVTNGSSLNWNNVSGNTWRATIPLNDDGMYKFSISASDKAGNRSQTFNAEFNIDTVSPQVSFSGIQNQHAYNDEIRPVIEIDDNNIDFSTVSVTLTGARNKDTVQLEGTVEETGGKYRFTANDLPHTAEYDDIYTLTAKAEDLAGNPSSSEVKFSVNRFGSTFVPDANSVSLIGKTVKETGDIIINEINTDRHPADFAPTVRVIRNGSNSVLEENKDYSVRLSTDAETGWYEYQYTINSAVFSDDGVYEIMIYSEDSAENKNYSNSIMKFSVDKTRPSVNYLNIEQGGTYKADSKLVTALLNDNLEIDPDSVSVYVNSSQLSSSDFSYDSQTSEISFYIPNSNSTQYVEIMACDMAGNELDPVQAKIENLFVSTSGARILLHKTWFKIAAASAGILAFGSGLLLFLKKKKKS